MRKVFDEEILNSVTHGVGLGLSVAGLAVLVVLASLWGDVWHIVGCSIFGATLVILYTASTLYHSVRCRRVKRMFRLIDHSCIFILIAGTYTPFALTSLRGWVGWTLFGVVWGLAIVGIVSKFALRKRPAFTSALPYLVMGWLAVIAIKPMFATIPVGGLVLLLAGGLAYTVGVVFYAKDRIRYYHAAWHMFVLAGSICHYFAVMYTLPLAA